MRETSTRDSICKRLPPTIHQQATTGLLYNNGTPDRYLDGPKSDLWIEFKQFDTLPRDGTASVAPVPGKKQQPKGHLTELQRRWLQRRDRHGKNAWVIAGLPDRRVLVLRHSSLWVAPVHVQKYVFSIVQAADLIEAFCL